MNKHLLLISLILFSVQLLSAQKGIVIKGRVFDSNSGTAVTEAHIAIKGKNEGAISDKNGNYVIHIQENDILVYSHIQYKTFEKSYSTTTFDADILLEPNASILPEAIVKPVINISKGMMFDVTDYYIIGDSILYAGYCYHYKRDKNPWLVFKSPSGDTIFAEHVGEEGKFYKDCLDNLHYLTSKKAYQLLMDNGKIRFEHPTDIKEFESVMYNCEINFNGKLIFSQFHTLNQVLHYYYTDMKTYIPASFRIIIDEVKMEMLVYEKVSLVNPDLNNPDIRFLVEMMYTPVFAPMVKVKDSLYIINYTQSQIESYNYNFDNIENIPIHFQNARFCKEEIIVDDVTGKVYAVFKNNGKTSIKEIFLNTGNLGQEISIPDFYWIDNLQVKNNKLYFLYYEKNNSKLRALYKMNLD